VKLIRLPQDRSGRWAGLLGSIAVHVGAVVFLVAAVHPPRPGPPVYAVNLVAAPAPLPTRAPEAVEREAQPAPPEPVPTSSKSPPAPAKAIPKPQPKAKAPARPAPPNSSTAEREPAPRAAAAAALAAGETPSTGKDAVTVKTPGLDFPYPEYLRNIVEQVYRRWDRPMGNAPLTAEISFLILRDGSVQNIHFTTPSGSFSFDLGAQGAVEAAGNARAFGSLPDGYPAEVLPVSFFFTPRQAP
jgi:outer membrane biosynthesis protein TonB